MSRPYTVEREIEGTRYVAQFSGLREAVRCMDECSNGESVNMEKFMSYVLRHVIVEPSELSMNDFDDMDTLSEVVRFGREVMQGRFHKEAIGEKPASESAL